MMSGSFLVLCAALSLQESTNGFLYPSTMQAGIRSGALYQLVDRYFQLEEMEDKETCGTEIQLKGDGTVVVGESYGPLAKSATGTWVESADGAFEMTLVRTFGAGTPAEGTSSLGEFEYSVERCFRGTIGKVGTIDSVSGSIFIDGMEVGFFELIDTSAGRPLPPRPTVNGMR